MLRHESYKHHGKIVWVRADLKGKHREYCLCHSCQTFKPCQPDNCLIAQAIFENCVKFNVVTPVFECPNFYYGRPDYSRVK